MEKSTRPSADKTRGQILKAAKYLFAKNGFNGASMSQIAARAKVNKSLIHHHFTDKATLWKAVKQEFVNQARSRNSELSGDLYPLNRRQFITNLLTLRYEFFESNADASRMLLWQSLEDNNDSLAGTDSEDFTFEKLTGHIKQMQLAGELTQNMSPEHIMYWLNALVGMQFFSKSSYFKNTEDRKQYLQDAIDLANKALA